MKKDFSQPFQESTDLHLIITSGNRYMLEFPLDDPHGSDFYAVLSFSCSPKESLTHFLLKHLFEKGIVVNSYRELARQHFLSYSLEGSLPGHDATQLCLLVHADLNDTYAADDPFDANQPPSCPMCNPGNIPYSREFVSLDEFAEKLQNSPYYPDVVRAGVTVLQNEASAELGPKIHD